jgi:hypothetical protein
MIETVITIALIIGLLASFVSFFAIGYEIGGSVERLRQQQYSDYIYRVVMKAQGVNLDKELEETK